MSPNIDSPDINCINFLHKIVINLSKYKILSVHTNKTIYIKIFDNSNRTQPKYMVVISDSVPYNVTGYKIIGIMKLNNGGFLICLRKEKAGV